ncbi:hypothetical protein EMCRGX_G002900 [Ephydatia muelleri]
MSVQPDCGVRWTGMALLNSGRAEALGEGVNYGSQSREQLSDALLGSALRGTYLTQQRHHHHHHLAFPQSTTAAGISASSSDVTVLSEGGHSGAESELGGGDYSMHHGDLTAVLQQPHLIQGLSAIPVEEQDRFLPIANIARIMRNALPKNGKVSKDAKECMQECVSEFISFITSEACDKCAQEKRKTVTGDDILYAMATLGFDNYIDPLKLYLQKYREFIRAEKGTRTDIQSEDSNDLFGPAGGGDTVTMMPTYSF